MLSEITVEWLKSRRACHAQINRFIAVFGLSAPLTRANLQRACSADLGLWWLAYQLLDIAVVRRLCAANGDAYRDILAADDAAWARQCRGDISLMDYHDQSQILWRDHMIAQTEALADALGLPTDPNEKAEVAA